MKLPRRSFAYYWASSRLKKDRWKYSTAVAIGAAIGMALAAFVGAFLTKNQAKGFLFFGILWLFVAFDQWERDGFRQVFEEQQRLLENAWPKKNA